LVSVIQLLVNRDIWCMDSVTILYTYIQSSIQVTICRYLLKYFRNKYILKWNYGVIWLNTCLKLHCIQLISSWKKYRNLKSEFHYLSIDTKKVCDYYFMHVFNFLFKWCTNSNMINWRSNIWDMRILILLWPTTRTQTRNTSCPFLRVNYFRRLKR
jgi:hypothetical protein